MIPRPCQCPTALGSRSDTTTAFGINGLSGRPLLPVREIRDLGIDPTATMITGRGRGRNPWSTPRPRPRIRPRGWGLVVQDRQQWFWYSPSNTVLTIDRPRRADLTCPATDQDSGHQQPERGRIITVFHALRPACGLGNRSSAYRPTSDARTFLAVRMVLESSRYRSSRPACSSSICDHQRLDPTRWLGSVERLARRHPAGRPPPQNSSTRGNPATAARPGIIVFAE